MTHSPDNVMTAAERRSSGLLAAVYALRLLGIFLLLPVFSLYAADLPGGDNKTMVGLAFGIYGLTQAVLQLPLGMASDRFGRKKVIYFGLALFAAGSFLSAYADNLTLLIWARALQGAGAVSAAVVALLADLTRDEVRTRAMAMVGLSIGLTFSVSLVLGPLLERHIGVPGIFTLTGVLILAAMALIHFAVPDPVTLQTHDDAEAKLGLLPAVLKNRELWRLNFGIFALHCAQMALFVALPLVLVNHFQLADNTHWKLYLPVTLIGMVLMLPAVIIGETRHQLKPLLLGAIVLLALAQFGLAQTAFGLWGIFIALALYFVGLNVLEAILPSWVSKISPPRLKGTAMGVYNTAMSLGLFVGSLMGGVLLHYYGTAAVFYFCSALMVLWAAVALFSVAPRAVKTLLFSVPEPWQNHGEALNCRLAALAGVAEAAISDNQQTLYLKVLPRDFDEAALKSILAESP
ncbi:MAG: MFS transporter [Neisseria sp.]|nr:MFS transporter [Neisseria sp.]